MLVDMWSPLALATYDKVILSILDHHAAMNRVSCARCGHHPDKVPQHTGLEDEATIISQETRRIDDLIRGLYEERARHLRRLNAIRSSTKSLPQEILADIFQRVCSTDEESSSKRHQFTLGAVSTHWRTVVWNTPQLWNKIELVLVRESADSLAPLLQLYLDNARSVPVAVQLDFRPKHSVTGTLKKRKDDEVWLYNCAVSLQSIIKSMCLPQNAGKVHTLHLHSILPAVLLVLPYLSSLRKLSLSFNSRLGNPGDSDAAKDGWAGVQNKLPWTALITSLDLDNVPVDICLDLLTRCPNLVHFSSTPLAQPTAVGDPCTTTITLPHLRYFKWSSKGSNKWDLDVLRFLRFPELQHLAFPVWDNDEFISHFLDFLAALSPDLGTLELFFFSSITAPRLPPIFKCVPQITQLIFNNVLLTNLSDLFVKIQNMSLMPLLRSFKYVHLGLSSTTLPKVAWDFFWLMEERKESGAKGFHFEFVNLKVSWALGLKGSLRELVEQGFDLEIVEGGVPVGWLRD